MAIWGDESEYEKIPPTEAQLARSECIKLVREFFNDDIKASAWFCTKNPLLGNVKPEFMFKVGKEANLLKFIKTQLNENCP